MGLIVKKIFKSIQGEGVHIGVPMDFIRLAGCSVRCPIKDICDTDYTNGDTMSIDEIYNRVSLPDVCITGGEPLEQNIYDLCFNLRTYGHRVHIQTSGTIDMSADLFALTNHVVCSPKGKLNLHRMDELKLVNYGQSLKKISSYYIGGSTSHYLQPLHKNNKYNMSETIDMINELNKTQSWKLGIQAHKIWGLN